MTSDSQAFRLEKFLAYSESLRVNLDARDEVVGLVFLGSAADTSRADEWSDHDFFVIAVEGFAESLRQNLDWLPRFSEIEIGVRETDHGLKVVYQDGQVLEFAVFEDSELDTVSAFSFAVAIDKCSLQQRMEAIEGRSVGKPPLQTKEFELFLCQLLIGVGRARRGEVLIAGQHIRSWAINNLLGLVRLNVLPVAGSENLPDNFNRYRRFEKQYPVIAERIENAQQMPLESCAQSLLEIAVEVCGAKIGNRELSQIATVRTRLGWI
ncbi:MAG: hypothetical protein RLZ28_790 [Actinomycetota bacterium]|jgi:hypothetical protein